MANVATYIQTALNTATGGTETVAWSVDHFVITSTDTTSTSEVSVTSTSTGVVGTDISGLENNDEILLALCGDAGILSAKYLNVAIIAELFKTVSGLPQIFAVFKSYRNR